MWKLKIQEATGEKRSFPVGDAPISIGASRDCSVCLRDIKVFPQAAFIEKYNMQGKNDISPYWLRVPVGAPAALLGDIKVREAELLPGVKINLGDSHIMLENESGLSEGVNFPSGTLQWKTCSKVGVDLLQSVKRSARTNLSVYLEGETGVGKEILAALIHAWSPRAKGNFVAINCGALSADLAESELFGHVKGSFTGAINTRPGALMQAHGGILFLDEVADLSLDIQVKLLRFIENGEIRPVGSDRVVKTDVRVICATNKPLKKLIKQGRFRQDLFYRLASIEIRVPPLRGRMDDIEFLAKTFAQEFGFQLSPNALLRLKSYSWPGNVRELRHNVERACGMAQEFNRILSEDDFGFLINSQSGEESDDNEFGGAILSMQEMERVLVLKALRLSSGNRTEAAKILGIARSTLFVMLKRNNITGPNSKLRHQKQLNYPPLN